MPTKYSNFISCESNSCLWDIYMHVLLATIRQQINTLKYEYK